MLVISSMWYVRVCHGTMCTDNSACSLGESSKFIIYLVSSYRTFVISFCCLRCRFCFYFVLFSKANIYFKKMLLVCYQKKSDNHNKLPIFLTMSLLPTTKITTHYFQECQKNYRLRKYARNELCGCKKYINKNDPDLTS